jgi:hypothetical protein
MNGDVKHGKDKDRYNRKRKVKDQDKDGGNSRHGKIHKKHY